MRLTAGVDEAGRGPLAGPVFAAAVILSPDVSIDGLTDSKRLLPAQRQRMADEIRASAVAWGVGRSEVEEIDRLNILQATLLAMRRAVAALDPVPDEALIDGDRCPMLACPASAIVKGDQEVSVISAASVLAKVERDREMLALDARYPGYGFAQHKGYPTPQHIEMLHALGASPVHRRSFAPVRAVLASDARGGVTPPLK